MTIYISGKITGTTDYKARFAEVEKKLKIDGHRVINPVKICAHIVPNSSWATYMRTCIRALTRADAIYLLRDWRKSPGAKLEHQIAVALGMNVLSQTKGE